MIEKEHFVPQWFGFRFSSDSGMNDVGSGLFCCTIVGAREFNV
jgi:hypothetical protein